MNPHKPKGEITPLVSHLVGNRVIDEYRTKRIVEAIAPYVSGIFVGGRTGEGKNLSPKNLFDLVRYTKNVNPTLPVAAGIWSDNHKDPLECIDRAVLAGADLLVLPPSTTSSDQNEICDFFLKMEEHCHSKKPMMLYVHPDDKSQPSFETIAKLAMQPGIVGIKYSHKSLYGLLRLLLIKQNVEREGGVFQVLAAEERLLAANLLLGADGSVSSIGNTHPRLIKEVYDAFQALGKAEPQMLQQVRTDLLYHLCYLGDLVTWSDVRKAGIVHGRQPRSKSLTTMLEAQQHLLKARLRVYCGDEPNLQHMKRYQEKELS